MFSSSPKPYTVTLPAIRGIQSGREYYVTMVQMSMLTRQFVFNEYVLPPEMRAQRVMNRARIPELTRYILNNPNDYIFSAITASVDRRITFAPLDEYDKMGRMGFLSVPTDAQFLINDGQHRKAAIEAAIKQNPNLSRETIAVVLFVDAGLKRSQQMFADLNKYAVKPTRSLSVLYDHRDPLAELVRSLILKIPIFKDKIEKERTSISTRSPNLFTLSAIYQATKAFLGKKKYDLVTPDDTYYATEFWLELPNHIPEWKTLLQGQTTCADLRKDYVHAHGVLLHAFGMAGNALLSQHKDDWKERLKLLEVVDWAKSNPEWNGRAIIGGRLSKAYINVILSSNFIKKTLGLTLLKEEERIEEQHAKVQPARSVSL
ncbi:MAG: DNA sulfur modification protein DndB [Nitrososphaerota archaeon]|nr:DNA sulfur modification protein DndB [Nitrososphaerota archaeon]MDG7049128.1 DNA sulfur modification protein DndB [Nitrososphaerota archaeon]MDG7052078.1 DNA sulfur modification protein DndB [Nitrososphaerota archaeon]